MAPKKNVATPMTNKVATRSKKTLVFLPASTTLPEYYGPETRTRTRVLADMAIQNPADERRPERTPFISLETLSGRSNGPRQSSPRSIGHGSPTVPLTPKDYLDITSSSGSTPGSLGKEVTSWASESSQANLDIMTVNATDACTVEEKLAEMERKISLLIKTVEEKDQQIAALKGKSPADVASNQEPTYPPGFAPGGSQGPSRQAREAPEQAQPPTTSIASLSVQQLQEMIANTIKMQYGGSGQNSSMYSKPYTQRIDSMRMPAHYQPPKFQQFDGKGNPKQHVAHFVETCNNAGTYGDLLVKQFVRSLRGNAFDWYVDLEPESIDGWEQLEREFLNRFFSTRRTVSMMELTNTRQRDNEPVVDYINRWRALSLDCKDRLGELSAVEMCIQGMHWELLYILQGIKPRTFEELATRAHDMEISIATSSNKKHPIMEQRKEKKDLKKIQKPSSSSAKEAMVVDTSSSTAVKISKPNSSEGRTQQKWQEKPKTTLREKAERKYPFPDSDVADMLEQLLQMKLIELPEPKRPEEKDKVNDPKFCKYHRIIGHPTERCFVFKDLVMSLRNQGKIILDGGDVAEAHQATIEVDQVVDLTQLNIPLSPTRSEQGAKPWLIRFGSIEPMIIANAGSQREARSSQGVISPVDDEEGWTLVTRRKKRQSVRRGRPQKPHKLNPPRPRLHQGRNERPMAQSRKLITEEPLHQKVRTQIVLHEFFPRDYFVDEGTESANTTSAQRDEEDEKSTNPLK